ncbi:hypothetical protein HZH68_003288 [Vespula germanica]|uniref:Aminopeptidase n=1 Tax=Vespula germanica TaxID=30212 RepID=A0A834NNV3_VESGE|nr:hypothetical protein HZH68_003288 [Vespula germanica]
MDGKKDELNIADHVHGARKRKSEYLESVHCNVHSSREIAEFPCQHVDGFQEGRFRELRRAAAVKICASHATTKLSHRLPKNIVPISYDLRILTKLAANDFLYEAEVRITLDALEKTNTIVLHAHKLRIDKDKSFLYRGTDKILIHDQYIDTNRQFYIVKCMKYFEVGRYTLVLSFVGEIQDDVFGFYRSSYEVDGQKKWIGITQFSPTYARQAFPCMDEPHLKATFTISIGHYSNQTATSNTDIKKIEEVDTFYRLTTFLTTPRMSTYLVGWSVHDYVVEISESSKDFKMWTRDSMLSHGSLALNQGWLIYTALQNWMEVENPIKKMDQFAIADFNFHAMENWGMITYRESVVLFQNGTIPMRKMVDGLVTMAHEYSHTWFGNLVTPEFWNVAWLKEGFASYFQYLGLSLVQPTWKMMDMFVVDYVQPTLLLDSVNHNRSMNGKNVGSPSSIMATLDFVTYRKGASIIRMIKHTIGENVFQKGLRHYLSEMSYRVARPYDLYNYLQRAIDSSSNSTKNCKFVKDVVESWANQVGYPLITITRNYTKHWTLVSQERFYLNRDTRKMNDNDEEHTWWIPLTFATSSSIIDFRRTRPKLWLCPWDKRTMISNFRDTDWVLFNVQQIGFYRVNYDETNWKMLIDHLRSKEFISIPSVNRAALLDDAFNLARAGYIDYSIPFDLSKYLKRETDYEPWLAAVNNFMFLNRILNKVSKVHTAFQKYAENLILPIYELLGFMEDSSDNVRTKLQREIILSASCALNNAHCLETSKMLFNSWISSSNETILPDLKSFVYCIGIRTGNDKDWLTVWKRLFDTDLHIEQELLLSALGCSRNPILLNKYLNVSITRNSRIRKQYRFSIVTAVTKGNPENVDHTLEFVENNLGSIIDSQGYDFLGKMFISIGEHMTTTEQTNKLRRFIDQNIKRLGSASKAAKKAIDSAIENAKWVGKYAPLIAINV